MTYACQLPIAKNKHILRNPLNIILYVESMHLALSSFLRANDERHVASAIDKIMSNKDSAAIPSISKMIDHANDPKPETVSLDECVALILHHNTYVCRFL